MEKAKQPEKPAGPNISTKVEVGKFAFQITPTDNSSDIQPQSESEGKKSD
jgi:hypothetical protein